MPENSLEKIKKQYEPLKRKYKLPEFSKLNEEFEIEKIQEKETDFLLREIRRAISDKISAFLRFFELFVNPQAAPVFVLVSLKNLTSKEKEIIERAYKELVELELAAVNRDISYDESKEAQSILRVFKKWQELKPELEEVTTAILRVQEKSGEKKGKSYFG
ncbi:MAG: hypothetical protein ACPLXC_01695 [Candidatus Pacearchaeota archaeon]